MWQEADLILKVKEPIEAEYSRMRENQILFTYLHLAASKACTDALIKAKTTSIAYETVEVDGALPLLVPMSEVAGRMATQVGADALLKPKGGRGVLLAGVPGVSPGKVVVIGGGIAGLNAAVIALGMGADVTVLDRSAKRLAQIDQIYSGRIKTLMSSTASIQKSIYEADLVIGAVLIPGARAPKLVTNQDVSKMKPGSVLVDFWAEWCGPCRAVGPILEEISNEYGDKLKIVKLNTDEEGAIAMKYGISSIPTMNVFVGGEVVKTIVGAKPKPALLKDLESFIK